MADSHTLIAPFEEQLAAALFKAFRRKRSLLERLGRRYVAFDRSEAAVTARRFFKPYNEFLQRYFDHLEPRERADFLRIVEAEKNNLLFRIAEGKYNNITDRYQYLVMLDGYEVKELQARDHFEATTGLSLAVA